MVMEIKCFANCKERKKDFINLFRICFPDETEKYIDFFFNQKINIEKSFGGFIDDDLICAVYLIEKTVNFSDTQIVIPWVVGAGTFPQYRRKGYMRELLRYITQYSQSGLLALYPFSHSYYKQFCYFSINSSEKISACNINNHSSYAYDTNVADSIFIVHDSEYLSKKILETDICGEKYEILNNNYAFCENNCLYDNNLSDFQLKNFVDRNQIDIVRILPLCDKKEENIMFQITDIRKFLTSLPSSFIANNIGKQHNVFSIVDSFINDNNLTLVFDNGKITFSDFQSNNEISIMDFGQLVLGCKKKLVRIFDMY